MADYVWARDGMILGATRVAGTDADEVEALPSRAIQRYLSKGLISVKQAAPTGPPPLWQSSADASAIVPVDNADSWIVGSDRMGQDTVDATKDRRAFFNKVKGAFRAGFANDHWNDVHVGEQSAGFGTRPKASGASSFAEGFQTTASGDSSHAEGKNTTASGVSSHAEGSGTTASGAESHAEGNGSTASGAYSHAEGQQSIAPGQVAHAQGAATEARGYASHSQGLWAVAQHYAEDALASGRFAVSGDAQASSFVVRRITTDATPSLLFAGVNTVPVITQPDANVLTLPVSRAFQLKISTVARRTDVQGEMAGWTWEGLIGRDSTGNARIIGTPATTKRGDAPATDAWAVAVSIDTTDATNNYVAVTVTGELLKTIRWVAKMEWVEVAG